MEFVIYLSFDGRCEEAFKHYEKVFGGKILMLVRNGDMPAEMPCAPGAENRIMHARLQVGDAILMGGDAPINVYSKPAGFSASIQIEDIAEAERIFRELSVGGTVMMPIAETFWARRFGMMIDRFGTPWMINTEKNPAAQETPSSKPFEIARTFDLSREELWKCFTDVKRMQEWWGPKGVKVVRSDMDLRPGGAYHYGMQMPDGAMMWGRQVYREIDDGKRLVFVNSFANEHGNIARHPLAPVWPIEMLTTMTFADAAAGKSSFSVTWTPIYPTDEELKAFEGGHESMRNGWTGTLDKLAEYVRTLADKGKRKA